jgi:hypothetical protein
MRRKGHNGIETRAGVDRNGTTADAFREWFCAHRKTFDKRKLLLPTLLVLQLCAWRKAEWMHTGLWRAMRLLLAEVSNMLSKCLNPRCSAKFQYMDQGRLFRIDFSDAARKNSSAVWQKKEAVRSTTYPIEHFWLCDECSQALTVVLDQGEVRLTSSTLPPRGPSAVQTQNQSKSYKATAS